ncbi:MAG TPA: hypothetical protein VGK59_02050 [Ohtaekwangia sp.]
MNKVTTVLLFAITVCFTSCKDKYDVTQYFSATEKDSLLTDIITYVYVRAPYADPQTRFEPRFRKYYVKQLPKFTFEKYYRDEQGVHYYYLIRPARSPQGIQRGVGGTFKLNADNKIVSFREIFNTPVAPLPDLQKRGDELFKRMVKQGNVDDYLKHPDYIEWPDKITYYDTIQYEWLIKPGI